MIMTTIELTGKDRDYYRKVRTAIFANPFSDERREVDKFITGASSPSTGETAVKRLIKAVKDQLITTFADQEKSLHHLQGEDRELVQYGVLFHLFHKYYTDFDNHITEQIHSGDTPIVLPFAKQALADIISYGIGKREAVRYFALFFQMRRAFYFINRIIGKSRCMKDLRRDLWNNIFTHDIGLYEQHLWNRMEDFSTMLLGQTGTGKGLAAAAIGRSGYIPFDEKNNRFAESFTKAFVSLNLSQFPEQLLESELFGHKKGAFTGAVEGHEGIFSRCSPYGAIFLDEIGEVSIPVQIKLLQVLQDRIFSPVGSHRPSRFQGRVIAATNRPIEELRLKGIFRDDFYYRLCSDIINVPTLAQRSQQNKNELEDLLAHTITQILGKPSPQLTATTMETISTTLPANYPWPGNVRELAQCVRRILLKKQYEGDITISESRDQKNALDLFGQDTFTAQQLLSCYCKQLYIKLGTYEAVARQTELDRRTVKKHIDSK